MGSPDSVSATMLLNSLIPAVCLLLVSNSHSLGLQGLKEQRAREGKKQVGLPCKTIVTEEGSEKEVPRLEEVCDWYSEQCETEYVNECAANKTNNKREAWSAPGRSPHVSHRVSEPRHDDGGLGQGALLPLTDHHLPSQPRWHDRWRVPHNLYSSLLPRAQKCRGGVRTSAGQALQPDSRG